MRSSLISTACPLAGAVTLEVRDGRPFVNGVFVNGHGPYRFLIDTGANMNLIESDLAEKMSLIAHAGHPCGEDFRAAPFLAEHPEYGYLKPILRDMRSGPWTRFSAGEKP